MRWSWNANVVGQSKYIAAVAVQAVADCIGHQVISKSSIGLKFAECAGRTGAVDFKRNPAGRNQHVVVAKRANGAGVVVRTAQRSIRRTRACSAVIRL